MSATNDTNRTTTNGHRINSPIPPPIPKSSYKIASIPGDGIGPEVIAAAVEILQALTKKLSTFELEFTEFDWGTERFLKTGRYTPEDYLEVLREFDAILFGSVGSPSVPDHISLWGLRLAICQPLQHP